jgi:rhodanese-related sulfurtransferase
MANYKSGTISKRMARRAEERRKKRRTLITFFIIGVVILGGVIWAVVAGASGTQNLPGNISVDEAYGLYKKGAFVLDVRTPEEWDEYHIPGTTLIPLDELDSRSEEVPQDQDVVVVCRSGNRSQVGRDILLQAGFTQVTSMDGGVSAWRDAGYPVE